MTTPEREKTIKILYTAMMTNTPYVSAEDVTLVDKTGRQITIREGQAFKILPALKNAIISIEDTANGNPTVEIEDDKLPFRGFLVYA